MRTFLSRLIMPLPVFYMLLLAALTFYLIGRKKTSKALIYFAAFWFLIISTPPVPRALVRSLENIYPHLTEEAIMNLPDSCDIIVLGGGHTDDMGLSANNQLSTTAIGRLTEGIRIHRMLPGSRLILSGYSGNLNSTGYPQGLSQPAHAITDRSDIEGEKPRKDHHCPTRRRFH